MKNLTYILDIGSSKLSLLACCTKNGKSAMVTCIDKGYDGFMDGEFFSTEQLATVIQELLTEMRSRTGKVVDSIYIGVPSEFSACVCKRVTRNFVPAKKLSELDIQNLFDGINDFNNKDDYMVVSYSPLQYEVDGAIVTDIGKSPISQLVMDCSYILVKNQFVELMQSILKQCGVNDIDFVSTALAQSQFAISSTDNALNPIAVVDVGHITTSVAIAKGEGLLMLSSFSLGGGHITADLMQLNNFSYTEADSIKHKVGLTIETKKDDRYIVYNGTKQIKSLINITNNIVKARIENIADVINRVISINDAFKYIPIYLTGDGLCNFRGIVNLIEAITGRKVYLLSNPLDNGANKYQTSKYTLTKIIGSLV